MTARRSWKSMQLKPKIITSHSKVNHSSMLHYYVVVDDDDVILVMMMETIWRRRVCPRTARHSLANVCILLMLTLFIFSILLFLNGLDAFCFYYYTTSESKTSCPWGPPPYTARDFIAFYFFTAVLALDWSMHPIDSQTTSHSSNHHYFWYYFPSVQFDLF